MTAQFKFATFVVLSTCLSACLAGSVLGPLPETDTLSRARAEALRQRGVDQLMAEARPDLARQSFAQSLERDPGDAQSRIWAALAAELAGEPDAAYEHLLWATRARGPIAELAIWEAYRAFTRRGQAEVLERVLAQVVAAPDTSPLVRARARHFLGQTLRFLGRFSQADQAFAGLGYVRQWMLLGPFDNDQNAGFDTAYAPETEALAYDRRYPGKLRQVGWRPVNHFDATGRVNLNALLDPSRWSTAYLVTWIHSPQVQPAAFRLAAYRGIKLWLNDRLLLEADENEVAALDQHNVGGTLERGWNKVLIKVCQRTGPWQLGLRVTDPRGAALAGLTFDRSIHPYPTGGDSARPQPAVDSLAGWLATQPDSVFLRVAEARLALRFGLYKRAVQLASALAVRHPKSPLAHMFLFAAHLEADHEGSALRALGAVDLLVPGLPQAVLARTQYEQRQKRYERAMRTLKPLLDAQPDLAVAQMSRIALLLGRGWNADAQKLLGEFARRQPDRAWTYRSLAATHFDLLQIDAGVAALNKALALRADHKGTHDDLINRALLMGQPDRALELIRKRAQIFPDQIGAALQEASILLAQKRYREAQAVCARLEKVAPDYWYLHKLRADILYRQGRRDEAIESYSRSLACAPDNPKLREYMDFLVHRPDPAFERYSISAAEVERLIGIRSDRASHPDAEALFLLDDHITHVFQDGSAKHQVHQIYQVLNEKGQRRYSKIQVPATSSFRLEVAETIQADGSRQEATSIQRGAIHFPSLQPGSIIHLAYSYGSASSSWMEDHFAMSFNFQGRDPTLNCRWVLVTPQDKALKILRRGPVIKQRTETLDGEVANIFTAQDVPMLHAESWRPPLRELRQAVYVSTVPSWEVLARWQNSLIQDQFEIDENIRRKTETVTAGSKSTMDKIEAIYHFVAKEIRYLNHDVGIFGKKPNKAINVFENRFGDCKDKATLMIAMLRHQGIKAAYAALRTRDRGQVYWEVPYAQTNHIITYIPVQEGVPEALFIDGTSSFGHFRDLPERDQGVQALILDGKTHQIVTTPEAGPAGSGYDVDMDMTIAEGKGLAIHVRDTWRGWYARRQRSTLHTEGKRLEELGKSLNYRYPGAKIDQAKFSGMDDLSPEAGADYLVRVPERVRQEGDTLRLKLLWPSQLTSWLAHEPVRRYDFFNLYPYTTTVRARLKVPAGYQVKQLPAAARFESDALQFSASCRQEDGLVECRRQIELKARRLSQADYEAFRELCLKADRAEEQDVVLEKAAN